MAKSTTRSRKIADLIHHELARIILKNVKDPRLKNFSLTAVDVSPDLHQAKVFYTVLEKENVEAVKKSLSKASGYLRHALAKSMDLRYVPQLHFVYDESIERGERMSHLIDQAIEKDQQHQKDDKNRDDDEQQKQ